MGKTLIGEEFIKGRIHNRLLRCGLFYDCLVGTSLLLVHATWGSPLESLSKLKGYRFDPSRDRIRNFLQLIKYFCFYKRIN